MYWDSVPRLVLEHLIHIIRCHTLGWGCWCLLHRVRLIMFVDHVGREEDDQYLLFTTSEFSNLLSLLIRIHSWQQHAGLAYCGLDEAKVKQWCKERMLPSEIDLFLMFTMFLLFILLKIPTLIFSDRFSTQSEWNHIYSVNNFEVGY